MSDSKRWKGVVFDFDGTLIDSVHEGRERFLRVASDLGLATTGITQAQIQQLWGVPGHILVETCWPDTCAQAFVDYWETFDSIHEISVFPGVKETLTLLAERLQLSASERG